MFHIYQLENEFLLFIKIKFIIKVYQCNLLWAECSLLTSVSQVHVNNN